MDRKSEPIQLASFGWFLLLALVCVGSTVTGQMFFPGQNAVPSAVRTVLTIGGFVMMGVGSERMLAQQFGGRVTLGLKPSLRALAGFLGGAAGGLLFVAAIIVVLWVVRPFHFARGAASALDRLPDLQGYLLSNMGEELIFRGYLLIVLERRFGLRIALLIVAIFFGLFHLPGLSGMTALKMVFTTAACSYLFAAAFLVTGTIWSAIGVHFAANVFLHVVSGLSGRPAILTPVFDAPAPSGYDPGFWVCVTVPLLLALAVFSRERRLSNVLPSGAAV